MMHFARKFSFTKKIHIKIKINSYKKIDLIVNTYRYIVIKETRKNVCTLRLFYHQ